MTQSVTAIPWPGGPGRPKKAKKGGFWTPPKYPPGNPQICTGGAKMALSTFSDIQGALQIKSIQGLIKYPCGEGGGGVPPGGCLGTPLPGPLPRPPQPAPVLGGAGLPAASSAGGTYCVSAGPRDETSSLQAGRGLLLLTREPWLRDPATLNRMPPGRDQGITQRTKHKVKIN